MDIITIQVNSITFLAPRPEPHSCRLCVLPKKKLPCLNQNRSSQDLADQFSPGGRHNPGTPLRHGIANLLPSVHRQNVSSQSMMMVKRVFKVVQTLCPREVI